jgi:hypothetical protein
MHAHARTRRGRPASARGRALLCAACAQPGKHALALVRHRCRACTPNCPCLVESVRGLLALQVRHCRARLACCRAPAAAARAHTHVHTPLPLAPHTLARPQHLATHTTRRTAAALAWSHSWSAGQRAAVGPAALRARASRGWRCQWCCAGATAKCERVMHRLCTCVSGTVPCSSITHMHGSCTDTSWHTHAHTHTSTHPPKRKRNRAGVSQQRSPSPKAPLCANTLASTWQRARQRRGCRRMMQTPREGTPCWWVCVCVHVCVRTCAGVCVCVCVCVRVVSDVQRQRPTRTPVAAAHPPLRAASTLRRLARRRCACSCRRRRARCG